MKSKIFIAILIIASFYTGLAQQPVDVYRKPLKDVLSDVERRYNIKLQYSESLIKGLEVNYATWRYRMDTEETLANILMPLDLIFQKTGDKTYQISRFTYYQRTPEEGKKHLDKLLSSLYKSAGMGITQE